MNTSTYVRHEIIRKLQIPHGFADSHMDAIIDNMREMCKKDNLDVDKAEVKVVENDRIFTLYHTDTVYFIWKFMGDE